MKNSFLLLLNMFAFLIGNSQSYHPVIQLNKSWVNMQYDVQLNSLCNYISGQQIQFQGDTIIQGTTYKKLVSCNMISLCQCPFYCSPYVADTTGSCNLNTLNYMFMREDCIAKKLFILDLNLSANEQILYDFSLNAGDTLSAQYQITAGSIIIVDSVGSTSLSNGEIRNIFYLNSGTFYIESIGGRNGLMSPLISFSGGSGETLGCVKLNGVEHYDGGICYVPVGINTNSNDPHLTVYYEKEYQNIKIKSKNLELKGEFKILNLEGKIIISKIIEEDNLSINANNLNSGIYLYRYEMLNGSIITGKISLTK